MPAAGTFRQSQSLPRPSRSPWPLVAAVLGLCVVVLFAVVFAFDRPQPLVSSPVPARVDPPPAPGVAPPVVRKAVEKPASAEPFEPASSNEAEREPADRAVQAAADEDYKANPYE